ncbi:MAG: hypothetical protein HOW73_33510 [Polyangiaceae bacterium]|nr:hypothetical protein [Polyangiaceae bacterium]
MRSTRLLVFVGIALMAPTGLMLVASAGCDNTVIVPDGDGGSGGSGGEGVGLIPSTNTGLGGEDAGHDALNEFIDPGCKDQPPPLEDFQCDPENQGNGDCQIGEGCYIYVDYPEDPCGQEIYGSLCLPEGFGQQGDPCGGAQDCSAGHVCVVTGSGTQCVVMCDLDGPSDCPSGLVCEPIDVDGFGGCL